MKKEIIKKKPVKNTPKQGKKPQTVKKTVSKAKSPEKKPLKTKTAAVKTEKSKKPAVKPINKPVAKVTEKKTITKSADQKPKNTLPVKKIEKPLQKQEKTENVVYQPASDMSLPEGNAVQQTGHRRPLIVIPK